VGGKGLQAQNPACQRDFSHEDLSILVVTGNRAVFELLRICLPAQSAARVEVLCADSLAAGLLAAAEGKVHAVLLDLHLADSDGLDTAIMMVRGARAIPVLVFAGPHEVAIAAEARRYGVEKILSKMTLADDHLLSTIEHAIAHHTFCGSLEQRAREDELWKARSRDSRFTWGGDRDGGHISGAAGDRPDPLKDAVARSVKSAA